MILIIDGNNIIMRSFHSPLGTLTTKAGEHTGSMLGVLNSLKKYLDMFSEADQIVIVWDGGRSQWRKALYPDYKATRHYDSTPEEKIAYDGLWNQITLLHKFLPSLGVHSIKLAQTEADDGIAAICQLYPDTNKIVISADKDMLQLIDEHCSIFSPYREKVIGLSNFYEETGVNLKAYMGYRALLGDTSDNIKGVPGIGEKTGKNLMSKYGNIDNILNPTPKIKEELMKSKRTARIFEQQNLQILGRNNKIMSFKYIEIDKLSERIVFNMKEVLAVDNVAVKAFLMKYQFASIFANFTPFILSFKALKG